MLVEKLDAAARPWTVPAIFGAGARLLRTHAFRLAALYFLAFAASVLGVLLFVYWTTASFIERQTEATLDAEITGLAEQYAQRGLSGLIQIVAARVAGDRGDAMIYLVTDPDGRPLAGNIAAWPAGAPTRSDALSFTIERKTDGRTELHPARGRLFIIPGDYRLLVGRDISDASAFRSGIRSTLLWAGLIALAAGLAGGGVMSRNLLRRVEQVNRTSERVMAGNLSQRVPLHGTGDEFDQLAANLNRMLEQIERLMTAMREVTDDVAHDLKTPLSRLRTRLERALADSSGGGSGQREAIRAAIDEADRLLSTFNALLSIAELESGAGISKTEPLDLSEIARAAAELYEPVAEENGFAVRFAAQPGVQVRGNRHLLSQALANLLDNALKYAAGGEIEISVLAQHGLAVLEVADHGPGIPEADRESVLDRFVRLEPSRTTPGNGLGLSLVRAIARRHGGAVVLDDSQPGDNRPGDNRPGLRVRIELPRLEA